MPTDLVLDEREGGSKSDMEDFGGSCTSLSEQVSLWMSNKTNLILFRDVSHKSTSLPPSFFSSRMCRGYASRMNVPPPLWEHQAPVGCLHTTQPTTAATQVLTCEHALRSKLVREKTSHSTGRTWTREQGAVKVLRSFIDVTTSNFCACKRCFKKVSYSPNQSITATVLQLESRCFTPNIKRSGHNSFCCN